MSDNKTGWIRYWICDKSGSGKERWNYYYLPWACEKYKDDLRAFIIDRYESWANWADSYSMGIEIDVVPPNSEVFIAIDHYETLAKDYVNLANKLKATVGLDDDSFPAEPDSSGS